MPGHDLPQHVVLFDGVCGLCDRTVNWLLLHDTAERIHFATLQGKTGARILEQYGVDDGLHSVVYVETTSTSVNIHRRSTAIFKLCELLPTPYRWIGLFGVLPRFVTDAVYNVVARVRYRIWGQLATCRLPTASERHRFLAE